MSPESRSDPPHPDEPSRDRSFVDDANEPVEIRGIWELTWPSMASFGLHALVGFIDMLFVAQLGSEAVAGVGLASQVWMVAFAIIGGVTTGTVALVARSTGAGDRSETGRVMRASLVLATAICLPMTLLAGASGAVFSIFGVEPAVFEIASTYLWIVLLVSIPLGWEFVISSALRGAGDVRTPLLIGIAMNVFNVIGDYAFIFGRLGAPALGASGSAVATALTFTLSALIFLGLWWHEALVIPRDRLLRGVDLSICRRVIDIGMPAALEQLAFNLGLFAFLRIVTTFGTEPVSAYLIGVRILAFSFIPGSGFATAASTLVGQYLGAEQPDRAEQSGWRAMWGAVAVMTAIGLTIIALAHPIAGWFGAAGESITDLTVTFIYILGAAQPLMAIEFSIAGALRGAGDTRFPLFALMMGLFVFRLGGACIVLYGFGGSLIAVWSCLLADWAVKAALLCARFRRGRWKTIAI